MLFNSLLGICSMERRPTSVKPLRGAGRPGRWRLARRGELLLALPTLTALVVLSLIEVFSRQRLLFASLASSAFLIYLDPQHDTNSVRTLLLAHLSAASTGLLTFIALGPGYLAAGSAMVATIVLMILLDAVHSPAVSTSLSFGFAPGLSIIWSCSASRSGWSPR
jgi:CBS-domain-containing membrane protein